MCGKTLCSQESHNWHWLFSKNSQAAEMDFTHVNSTTAVEENIPLVLLAAVFVAL